MATTKLKAAISNFTAYARSIGYNGKKDVLVAGGLVISHRGVKWTFFCDLIKYQKEAGLI